MKIEYDTKNEEVKFPVAYIDKDDNIVFVVSLDNYNYDEEIMAVKISKDNIIEIKYQDGYDLPFLEEGIKKLFYKGDKITIEF